MTTALTGAGKTYGGVHALHDVTVTVAPGVTALLGPNGAGKSTLLRILATAERPDTGAVRILGLDPADPAQRHTIRAHLGYLPQDPQFYGWFTAAEFVDYMALLHEIHPTRRRRHEVRRVLDAVGLTDRMHVHLRRLSGGQRRRAGIAQALLGEPHLLILDEPTVGLDPVERLRVRRIVSTVARHHSVVLATHLMDDVAAVCDRAVVLHQGAVAFDDTTAALAAHAAGRVWTSTAPDPGAEHWWRTGHDAYRNIGDPPPGATTVTPTVEDGYLLFVDGRSTRPRELR